MESMVGVSREQETKKQMLHMEEFPEMSDIYKMMIKEEFLNAALQTMKEEYGSINQFMINGLGISMKQKEDFKQKVLE